jgi:DNA-binding transcriptional ArsR family regulator
MDFKEQANFLKNFTHPVRLEILDILLSGEQCVCHLEAHLGYRQAYISQQLMVLKEVGIVEETRQGRNIYYRIADQKALHLLSTMESGEDVNNNNRAKKTIPCPCPKCNPGRQP